MTTSCCGDCFGDRGLKNDVIPSLSTEKGVCSHCAAEDVDLVAPARLREYFELLINTYEPASDGKPLVDLMKMDWDLFHHPAMDNARSKSLLARVLENDKIVDELFSPSNRFKSDVLNRWEELRTELMYVNRYFPAAQLDGDRLEQLLSHLPAHEIPTQWFRARLQLGDTAFPISEMGAPPKRSASVGRANPPGIPYLYLASTPETAVSEIRPHTGEIACVADFSVAKSLSIVDLRNPRRLVSPFLLENEDEIGFMRSDIAFLERLGDELTRPVVPHGASIDYVPSQYLCEFIKKCGYSGVIYRSSVGLGMNLALFAPRLASAGAVKQYVVKQVSVDVKPF